MLDPDEHGGWDDPEVRQSAHDLYNDLVANARRATERGDYGRLPVPADPDDRPPTPPAGGGAGSPARIYRGFTTPDGERRVTVTANGITRDLDPRLDLRNHSPTGLNWAYGGSGPAQLALALLADALGDDRRALALYQDYKWRVVSGLDNAGWELTAGEVWRAADDLEARQRS